jgi:type III secretory pathway lipoprotein EscJ
MRMWRIVFCVGLIICAAGCGTSPVADDLPQREANEIVSVLRRHGIDSQIQKQKGGHGRYSVVVSQSEFGESVTLLSALGLPLERKTSFSDLVSQSGILPSSREVESLRLDRAAAAELEDLLKGHPSVAAASVVVRSHGLEIGVSPSVSAVIQTKQGSILSVVETKQVIARTVPGLKAEEVVVSVAEQSIQPSTQSNATAHSSGGQIDKPSKGLVPFLLFWKVPEEQYAGLASLVVGLLLLMGALAGIAGYILGQYFMSRNAEEAGSLEPLDGAISLTSARLSRIAAPQDERGEDPREGRDLERGDDE